MFTGMLHTHTLAAALFLLLYLIKTTLLVLNRKEALTAFSAKSKVAEIVISSLFLLTGLYLAFNSGNIGAWFWVKIIAVVSSIPLAVLAFKRMNKPLALLAMMFIVYAYGISETKNPFFKTENLSAKFESASTAELGKTIFENQCMGCHGADGKGGLSGAKDLSASQKSPEERIEIIRNGKNAMMAYKNILSPEQIDAVAQYVETLKQ